MDTTLINRGVTGIRDPDSEVGLHASVQWLMQLDPNRHRIINGVCIGMDEIIGQNAHILGFTVHGVVPCDLSRVSKTYQQWCTTWEHMPDGTDLIDRSRYVVMLSYDLTAFTRTLREENRSGTWATVRHCIKMDRPVYIRPLY